MTSAFYGCAYLDNPDLCCSKDTTSPGVSCFESVESSSHRGCLNSVSILARPGHERRCTSSDNCLDGSICIRPDDTERLMRLTVHRDWSSGALPEVILWSGPKEEVWEEGLVLTESSDSHTNETVSVEVGILMPRHNGLPVWLPLRAYTFWQ